MLSRNRNAAGIFGIEDEQHSVLFVLFIPSLDKKGRPLPKGQSQEAWAQEAGDLLTQLFGRATLMPSTTGKRLSDEGEIITEPVQLVHAYAGSADAADDVKVGRLAAFLHRMGKEAKQEEVAVLIGEQFHRIRKFNLAR